MNPSSIGFPLPDDAPEKGACIRIDRPEPGLAVVVFDPPHRSFPIFDAPLLRDLTPSNPGIARGSR